MTFLVAGLMITSAISLSSCSKTDTDTDANAKEWIPTTFDFVTNNGLTRDDTTAICPYCPKPVAKCDHGIDWRHGEVCDLGAYDSISNTGGHYHDHCFNATGPNSNCIPAGQPDDFCPHKGRKHRHVVVYWTGGFWNGWHLGGGCNGF